MNTSIHTIARKIVCAATCSLALPAAGQAVRYSFEIQGYDLGVSAAGVGDIDGDGASDIAIGLPRFDPNGLLDAGAVRVHSGATGQRVWTIVGAAAGDMLGSAVAGAGDVDGDGFDDIISGSDHGVVWVFGRPHIVNGSAICQGTTNSTGQHATLVATSERFAVAANDVVLTASNLPPGCPALMLASRTFGVVLHPTISGVASDGRLCNAGGPIGRYARPVTGHGGTFELSVDLDAVPFPPAPPYAVAVQPGETWYWQCWYRDTGAPGTSNFTDAVKVTLR